MKIERWIEENIPSLANKTYIVTGANSGVGYHIALNLSKLGAKVYLACRSEKRALDAIKKMKEEDASLDLTYLNYDQSDKESIEHFASYIIEHQIKFDGLVLNAAIYHPKEKKKMTKDGFPQIMMTNYLGVFHLLEVLGPYLTKLDEYKIVAIGSLEARNWKKDALARTLKQEYKSRTYRYNVSKMMLTKLMIYFASNSENYHHYAIVEPGITQTDITKNMPRLIAYLGKYFLKLFFHSPNKASLGALLALVDEDDNKPNYYVPRGLFSFSGFPKKRKLKRKHKLDVDYAYIVSRQVLYDE